MVSRYITFTHTYGTLFHYNVTYIALSDFVASLFLWFHLLLLLDVALNLVYFLNFVDRVQNAT
jgi:hypothetical protein